MSFPGMKLQRAWHLIDANGQTVGRLANQIALILKGKHKPTYMPGHDMGDTIVVVNCEKVKFSGRKWTDKLYRWHTGYPGGLKERSAKDMMVRRPLYILHKAVTGMLRKNNLRKQSIMPRLKLFVGPEHPHTAQLPTSVEPLPQVPKARVGTWHFGLKNYADPNSYLEKTKSKRAPPTVVHVPMEEA